MKGVAFTHPPTNLRAQVDEAIATALDVSKVKPGELVMVGIGTNVGWNAAVALKTPSSFEVEVFHRLELGAEDHVWGAGDQAISARRVAGTVPTVDRNPAGWKTATCLSRSE